MEKLHDEPPVSKVTLVKEDGSVKTINVRKTAKPKVPPSPTGEVLRCPFCQGEHKVMINSRKPPRKSFTCPKTGTNFWLKKEAQEYLQSLVIRKEECRPVPVPVEVPSPSPKPVPKPAVTKPEPGTEPDDSELVRILKEAMS